MGHEIERKFLVRSDGYRGQGSSSAYRQGYLSTDPDRTVRIRAVGDRGLVTIKGRSKGATRAEYEYDIPVADAHEMLGSLCERPIIEKTRHRIEHAGHTWEVDEFHGDNAGLVVAEIELGSETEAFEHPDWLGEEVTGDERYFNSRLVEKPYTTW